MLTKPSDFFDVAEYEKAYYRPCARMITSNHIFSVNEQDISVHPSIGEQIVNMIIKEADVPDAKVQILMSVWLVVLSLNQTSTSQSHYHPSLARRRIHG